MSESAPTAAETRRIAEVERDRVRFEEEALELSDQVYRVARRLSGSREEAEDLVQDTYARAFRAWQQYQPGDEPPRVAPADPDQPEHRSRPEVAAQPGPAASRGRRLLPLQQARVDDCRGEPRRGARDRAPLAELGRRGPGRGSARLPRHVVLVDIGEFSYADAAQILDIPVGTVMSRLHRGRRILKQLLAEKAVTV